MVIDDLNFFAAISGLRPLKADAPLLVNADAVLAFPVPGQGLQMVAPDLREISQAIRRFKNAQPFFRLMAETIEGSNPLARGEVLALSVPVAPNHAPA